MFIDPKNSDHAAALWYSIKEKEAGRCGLTHIPAVNMHSDTLYPNESGLNRNWDKPLLNNKFDWDKKRY